MSTIPLARPVLGLAELEEVRAVLESGTLTQGPRVAAFEGAVADYLGGSAEVIATTSATTALHLAMCLLEIGPGDEVVLPSFTFPATVNVVLQQGAVPVLADVELDTFTLDPGSLATRLTPRTRAVMPVHLFGLAADLDAIRAVTAPRGIPLVEDAACALGARYRGRPCGGLGEIGCFSFHPRKIVTTGEGGMLVTRDPEMARRARRLRQHGGEREANRFRFVEWGYNYRMSDIQAAVGLPQMRRLEELVAERRRLAQGLSARLADLPELGLPGEPAWARHTYQAYVALLPEGVDRDGVIRRMAAAGVEATLGTYAVHAEPYVQARIGGRDADLPGSLAAVRRSLALPLYPGLTESDLDRVAAALRAALGA